MNEIHIDGYGQVWGVLWNSTLATVFDKSETVDSEHGRVLPCRDAETALMLAVEAGTTVIVCALSPWQVFDSRPIRRGRMKEGGMIHHADDGCGDHR